MKIKAYLNTLDNLKADNTIMNADTQAMDVNQVLQLENSVCVELDIDNLLDYYPYIKRQNVLSTLLTKIRYDGTIIISGTDLAEACRKIHYGDNTPEKACEILYGKQKDKQTNYKSCTYLEEIETQLKQANFQITRTTLINHTYTFIAKRLQPTKSNV